MPAEFFWTRQVDALIRLYEASSPDQQRWLVTRTRNKLSPIERLAMATLPLTEAERVASARVWLDQKVEKEGSDDLYALKQATYLDVLYADERLIRPRAYYMLKSLGTMAEAVERVAVLWPEKDAFHVVHMSPIKSLTVPNVIEKVDTQYEKFAVRIDKYGKQVQRANKKVQKAVEQKLAETSPNKRDVAPHWRRQLLAIYFFQNQIDLFQVGEFEDTYEMVNAPRQLQGDPNISALWNGLSELESCWLQATSEYTALVKSYLPALRYPLGNPGITTYTSVYRGIRYTFCGFGNVTLNLENLPSRWYAVIDRLHQQSERYFPGLIEKMPRVEVWAYNPYGGKTPGANYSSYYKQIRVFVQNSGGFYTGDPNQADLQVALQMLVHEAGHHVFKMFSQEIRDRLTEVLQPSGGAPVDIWVRGLRKFENPLMAIMGNSELTYGGQGHSSARAREWLQNEHPVAWLQLLIASAKVDPDYTKKHNSTAFQWKPIDEQPFHMTTKQLENLPQNLQVLSWPVTPYGAVNAEETFCEALGLLIAYGPMAVLEPIREWLYRFIPKLRRNPDSNSTL
ncbi:MAG: hypothetical protein EBU84_08035 [Actinobacteria bacterium]|nr:hypothetical protein [Actinomycetota bacterium]